MSHSRPLLRLVPPPSVAEAPDVLFCGHCAAPPPTELAARSRVCAVCGLGVVISAAESVVPEPGAPFAIVDGTLTLCALSQAAEQLLGVDEPDAVNRHVADFLESAEAEADGAEAFLRSIISVASGQSGAHTVVVRPAGEFGVRYAARIARCGPPAAALVVLSDGEV